VGWYAIRVRAQQETIASQSLKGRGLEEFLPLFDSRRCWTDRVKVVARPLLAGYVFCRFSPNQLPLVLDAAGCVQVVKFGAQLAPVPDEDIQALRRLVESGLASPHPYVCAGTPVRICSGAFKNLEGYVQRIKNRDQLIISLHLLQRSVSVQLETDAVQVLKIVHHVRTL
jgi:transcription antitermination factor NusG